jgi:hypothetical protein
MRGIVSRGSAVIAVFLLAVVAISASRAQSPAKTAMPVHMDLVEIASQ